MHVYACTASHIIIMYRIDVYIYIHLFSLQYFFSLQYPSQELLNVRDDLERQRQELTEKLGRVEEQRIACLRETEETRQALVEADGHCSELQTKNSLLEGQVHLYIYVYMYILCRVFLV